MFEISSKNNEKIKDAVRLGESASFRNERDEFFLEGARLCYDAVQTGIKVRQAFFTEEALTRYDCYTKAVEQVAEESYIVPSEVAKKLAKTDGAQGVFCVCRGIRKNADAEMLHPEGRYLALENVQDPANLGAVCRTAEALGITGLIVSGGCDIYNPKALRASMGSSLRLEVLPVSDLPAFLQKANAMGMLTLASTPREDAEKLGSISFSSGVICVVGNEGNGITEETFAVCRKKVTVPMAGRAESLNASAAAAILMWELTERGNL